MHSPFRTPGCGEVEVQQVRGRSTLITAYASSPLQLLTVRPRGISVWVYTSSLGGGYVAGDQTALDITIQPGARCFISSQAMTKVYRNPAARPCLHRTTATVEAGALLVYAPDPVQPFSQASYAQRQHWNLAPTASLVLLDWFSSGRVARGECWEFAGYSSRNDVFVEGRPAFIDALRLSTVDGVIAGKHRTGCYGCFGTLLLIGPALRALAEQVLATVGARPVECRGALLSTASPVRDGVVLRIAGRNVEAVGKELYAHLRPLREILGDDPWQRKW